MAKLDMSGPIGLIKAHMRALAVDLHTGGDAQAIVVATTEAAAKDIRSEYGRHRVTGTLASRVRVQYKKPLVGVVVAAAPHATIFEKGTKARFTKGGAGRGSSPPHEVISSIAPGHRARMVHELADLLRKHGLQVSGA